MPSITYTPAEQQQIDALNAAVKNAQAALDGYNGRITTAYNNMRMYFASPELSDRCYKKQATLEAQLSGYGSYAESACKGWYPGIPSECSHCSKNVQLFNAEYNNWKSAQQQAIKAQSDLTSAQANLKNLLSTLNNSPDIISQQQTNVLTAGITKAKWWIFGIIVVVIFGTVIFLLRKKV